MKLATARAAAPLPPPRPRAPRLPTHLSPGPSGWSKISSNTTRVPAPSCQTYPQHSARQVIEDPQQIACRHLSSCVSIVNPPLNHLRRARARGLRDVSRDITQPRGTSQRRPGIYAAKPPPPEILLSAQPPPNSQLRPHTQTHTRARRRLSETMSKAIHCPSLRLRFSCLPSLLPTYSPHKTHGDGCRP